MDVQILPTFRLAICFRIGEPLSEIYYSSTVIVLLYCPTHNTFESIINTEDFNNIRRRNQTSAVLVSVERVIALFLHVYGFYT
jgi:hypothetical protein